MSKLHVKTYNSTILQYPKYKSCKSTFRACLCCRLKHIKCNGVNPCSTCFEEKHLCVQLPRRLPGEKHKKPKKVKSREVIKLFEYIIEE